MTYSLLSDFGNDHGRMRELFARYALRGAGLGLIALAALLTASLLTWHIDDPSFSYPGDGPAANILGRPGAAFADLAMQFLGFAAVALIFPLVIVGWGLFRLALPRYPLRQALSWLGGTLLLAAALACRNG